MDWGAPLGRWGERGGFDAASSGGMTGHLDPRTLAFARAHLGDPQPAPLPHQVPIGPSRITSDALGDLFGSIEARTDEQSRVRFSRGMSYVNMVSWRSNDIKRAPDAVVFPSDHEQVLAVLTACAKNGVCVVPVGGGTSVTGGIDTPEADLVVAVSTDQINGVMEFDEESAIVTVGAGITGPELEAFVNPRGWTLGHFPQSFERASIGGYIAARSSGQSSSGYGRIEDLLVGAQVATPVGTWRVGGYPAASSGPDLRHLVLGSEGTLGVVTSAQLRVRALPTVREYTAAIVPGEFATAAAVVRELTRSPLRPTVLRASDPAETEALVTMSAPGGLMGWAFAQYLRVRRARPGSLMIVGFESASASTLAAMRAFARETLANAGAVGLGQGPGRSWRKHRFHGPFQRDELMDSGYLVETFETVVPWSRLISTHDRLSALVRHELGSRAYVMAHISHSYDVGASLYFTVLAGGWSDPSMSAAKWSETKSKIMAVLAECEAAISHHHGVGRDHRDWLASRLDRVSTDVLAQIKRTVDPAGIMNPGALISTDGIDA